MAKLATGLLIGLSLLLGACSTASEADEEYSTAYKLYVIDTGELPLNEDASEIRPYRRQLLLLSQKCTNRRARLGDFAVTVKESLEERFVDVSTLDIMRLVNIGLEGQPRQSCEEAFALAGVALETGN